MPSQRSPSAAGPMMSVMRSRISRAALLVKVTASSSHGRALPVARMCASRVVSTRVLPVPAPGQHQHRPLGRLHRRALLGVQAGEVFARRRRDGGELGNRRVGQVRHEA